MAKTKTTPASPAATKAVSARANCQFHGGSAGKRRYADDSEASASSPDKTPKRTPPAVNLNQRLLETSGGGKGGNVRLSGAGGRAKGSAKEARVVSAIRNSHNVKKKALKSKVSEACIGKKKLTLEQKAEIIRQHSPADGCKAVSATILGTQYGVRPRQIRRICSVLNRAKIEKACKSGVDSARKSLCEDKYPELTRELLEWC
mmetsp:Transcript_14050/g.29091  ORF Transcript_14050/g.29091 Transcript_14050/m.29091 type:complete len:203 (+) Transcript_14050:33-641(+)